MFSISKMNQSREIESHKPTTVKYFIFLTRVLSTFVLFRCWNWHLTFLNEVCLLGVKIHKLEQSACQLLFWCEGGEFFFILNESANNQNESANNFWTLGLCGVWCHIPHFSIFQSLLHPNIAFVVYDATFLIFQFFSLSSTPKYGQNDAWVVDLRALPQVKIVHFCRVWLKYWYEVHVHTPWLVFSRAY